MGDRGRGTVRHVFWLDDGTAAILIDPSGAELVLSVRHRYDNTGWKELPPAVERALALIIADRDETALVSSLRWRMAGYLLGGPILALACAWALLTWSGAPLIVMQCTSPGRRT